MSVHAVIQLKKTSYRKIKEKFADHPHGMAYGQNLGQYVDWKELDDVTHALGLPSLQSFIYEPADVDLLEEELEYAPEEYQPMIRARYERARQQKEWHNPADALPTVAALLDHYRRQENARGVDWDLEMYQAILAWAQETGDKFRIRVDA